MYQIVVAAPHLIRLKTVVRKFSLLKQG